MEYITSRVTYGNEYTLAAVKDWYESNKLVHKYIMCREAGRDASRDHVHIYLEYQGKSKNLRQNFKNKFKQLKGNEKIQFKSAIRGNGTIEGAENYTCKGFKGTYVESPPDIVGFKGYTESDVIHIHDRYWTIRKELLEKKKKYKKCNNLIDKFIFYIKEHHDRSVELTFTQIASHIIDYYNENKKMLPHVSVMNNYITTVDMYIDAGSYNVKKEEYINMIMEYRNR